MTDLIERYIHQVGRYLPPKERGEIEAELRSLIQDKLDDRYGGEPSQAELTSVLVDMGDPYQMASSYRKERYLIGPNLYPWMLMILNHGWLIVPSVVIFLYIFGVLTSSQAGTVTNLVIEPTWAALQATFIFSAVVVFIFAIIQQLDIKLDEKRAFNPSDLPKVGDPRVVDWFEVASAIAFGTFFILLMLYFVQVGGLTLRFNLSDPGAVIPFPMIWMLVLILAGITMNMLHVVVLWRNRWMAGLWLTQTVLEMVGIIAMYFALLTPIYTRIIADNPALADIPMPEILAIAYAVITLVQKSITFVKLRNYSTTDTHHLA